jgi:hypothetical protein
MLPDYSASQSAIHKLSSTAFVDILPYGTKTILDGLTAANKFTVVVNPGIAAFSKIDQFVSPAWKATRVEEFISAPIKATSYFGTTGIDLSKSLVVNSMPDVMSAVSSVSKLSSGNIFLNTPLSGLGSDFSVSKYGTINYLKSGVVNDVHGSMTLVNKIADPVMYRDHLYTNRSTINLVNDSMKAITGSMTLVNKIADVAYGNIGLGSTSAYLNTLHKPIDMYAGMVTVKDHYHVTGSAISLMADSMKVLSTGHVMNYYGLSTHAFNIHNYLVGDVVKATAKMDFWTTPSRQTYIHENIPTRTDRSDRSAREVAEIVKKELKIKGRSSLTMVSKDLTTRDEDGMVTNHYSIYVFSAGGDIIIGDFNIKGNDNTQTNYITSYE